MSYRLVCVLLVCLAVAAGFSPADAQCSADPWADTVVESSFTAGDPMAVLGPPDGALADFEEVGTDPGFVTVAFVDDVVVDGAGDDFIIHVVDFPQSEFIEAFEVFASEDGVGWSSLGMVFPVLLMGDLPEALGFDLAGTGLATITQVKVVGLNVDFVNQGEGVDIDAFEALNCEMPVDSDLMACLDDLGVCDAELGFCEGDLEICSGGFDACRENLGECEVGLGLCETGLDVCEGDLETCAGVLETCAGDVDESAEGLAEIRRLLGLPPGQRESSFTCSGALCGEIQATIGMLVAPPGQNVKPGKGPKKKNRK